jgi:hypothetical protein
MVEYLRGVSVEVEIDTNKVTHNKIFLLQDDETLEEFAARVSEYIRER